MKKNNVYTFLMEVPANTTTPVVLHSFTVNDDCILKELIINVFDDVDGTAGIRILVNNEYTIPDTEHGDAWFSGDNSTLKLELDNEIEKGSTFVIIGQNNNTTTAKHFFVVFNFKNVKKGVEADAPVEQ